MVKSTTILVPDYTRLESAKGEGGLDKLMPHFQQAKFAESARSDQQQGSSPPPPYIRLREEAQMIKHLDILTYADHPHVHR